MLKVIVLIDTHKDRHMKTLPVILLQQYKNPHFSKTEPTHFKDWLPTYHLSFSSFRKIYYGFCRQSWKESDIFSSLASYHEKIIPATEIGPTKICLINLMLKGKTDLGIRQKCPMR